MHSLEKEEVMLPDVFCRNHFCTHSFSMDSLYKTFLWESAYYGIIASVIGSVLGYVCTIFIEAATSDTLQLVAIPVIPILEATLLAVGACLMATAIPLRKISKMSIVDSIETVE